MWISDNAIRKPVVTVVVTLALVIFGGVALLVLDTDEFPRVDPPVVVVTVPYPGASPEVVEREVVDRMEEAFASIASVDEISSTSGDGFAVITVTFLFEKDPQQASQDVRDELSELRADLPPEMEEPSLQRFSLTDLPIVSLTLSSDRLSSPELTQLADPGLTRALRGIAGVADVQVIGGVERQLTVELDPAALVANQVGVDQVVQAIQSQNLAVPVGRLNAPYTERTLRLRGRLEGPSDFEELVVTQRGGRAIRLGSLGEIRDGSEEPRSLALFEDEDAVGIDIVKSPGYSTTAVSEAIREEVARLQTTLPDAVTLRVVRDAGDRVERSVEDVQRSLLEGAALTIVVVFLFLASWRSTVITGLALPVSVLSSFIAVWAFGFTLNTMSLLGLSLAIGILIDDAIVVRENIVRHMEMGKDHRTAAHEGTAEIGLAVAATTFAIVVVFVPIAFMGGIAQQWFAPFALTIACAVLVSLFVAFSLDPMLSSIWPDPAVEGSERGWLTRKLLRFNALFERLIDRYAKVIAWALRHRLAVALIALVSFFGALAMPALGLVGGGFFPVTDSSELSLSLETPPGSSLEYTRRKALEAGAIVRELEGVDYTYTTLGGQGGTVDEGSIYVRLLPKNERALSQQALQSVMRERLGRIVGADVAVADSGFGPQKQIELQLTGPDIDRLSALAEQLAELARETPGVVDVGLSTRGQKPELEIWPDRALAGALGLSVGQLAGALRPAFAGLDAGDWIDPTGEAREVWVRLGPDARATPEDVAGLPLMVFGGGGPGSTGAPPGAPGSGAGASPSASGGLGGSGGPSGGPRTVPLGQVADVVATEGPAAIDHLERERIITVGANVEGVPLSEAVAGLEERLARFPLPEGYTISQGGETESQQEVFGRILLALGVAIVLMYLTLVLQFGSFLDPIPILASLPLSLIGVMLALWATGSTLNLMSMIGVILLMGIVAKNAILLIDFAKWAERDGLPRHEAIVQAGKIRLRPIVMTSVAIIAGMLPVAIGSGEGADFRAPLGRAVIGGVVTSTLLTLLVIPTFYDVLSGGRDRLFGLVRRFRQRRAREVEAR